MSDETAEYIEFDESTATVAPETPYTLILPDANGVAFICHAAIHRPDEDDPMSDSLAATVAEATMRMLDQKALLSHPTAHVIMCWDGKHNRAHRRTLLPCYKFGRKGRGPELRKSFHAVFRAARARGYQQVVEETYEADDVIASYVAQFPEERILIVSRDGDLHQLLSERVHQCDPVTGLIHTLETKLADGGASHLRHTREKAIKGDSGDNIGGLYRVGDAAAENIIAAYPTFVEDCVAGRVAWNRVPPKEMKLLISAGRRLVHPVTSSEDKLGCSEGAALKAVVQTVRETLRLISLETGLDVEVQRAAIE